MFRLETGIIYGADAPAGLPNKCSDIMDDDAVYIGKQGSVLLGVFKPDGDFTQSPPDDPPFNGSNNTVIALNGVLQPYP